MGKRGPKPKSLQERFEENFIRRGTDVAVEELKILGHLNENVTF